LTRHEVGISAKKNVGSAAGHVGRDRHHTQASSLGDYLGLFLVELRVQHDVANALALEDL
jgi:hypothetical protein